MNKGKIRYSFFTEVQVKAVLLHKCYNSQRNTFLKNKVSCSAPTGVRDLTGTEGEELNPYSKHR